MIYMPSVKSKYRVGVLGATGSVGQRFIELLGNHELFYVTAVGASEKSAGKMYKDVTKWKLSSCLSMAVASLPVLSCTPESFKGVVDFVFSALDSSVAGDVESDFANSGIPVFSNSMNHRLDPDVPILIPYINSNHVELIKQQRCFEETKGFIVTNANCSSTGISIAVAPIHRRFGIDQMVVTTLQAVSGAGYPGVPSMDILDNCVPYIKGEEEKLELEPAKILSNYENGRLTSSNIVVSAMCHRVPITDGHLVSVSIKLASRENLEGEQLIDEVVKTIETFSCPENVRRLPSCPDRPIDVRHEPDRPQSRLDRLQGGGMTVVVGRVRSCPLLDIRLTCVAHNTIIGAAGGSILNAELCAALGYLRRL